MKLQSFNIFEKHVVVNLIVFFFLVVDFKHCLKRPLLFVESLQPMHMWS